MSLSPSQPLSTRGATRPDRLWGYEIIDVLGEGAGSVIYAACQADSNQIYALKHVICREARDQRYVEQLQTELEVGQKVNHPGLRRSVEMKINRNWRHRVTEAALVMEMFDGVALDVQTPQDLATILHCAIKAAEALQWLHTIGYLHCDLKPNNILLNHAGEVKIIDLGQACRIGTRKARIQGTPDYIAPEQVQCEPLTVRTDVYNLGATFYWVLTGQKLPTLYTARKQRGFLTAGQIHAVRELNAAVPANVSDLVMECVQVAPVDRPGRMGDVVRRLEAIHYTLTHAPVDVGEEAVDAKEKDAGGPEVAVGAP